MWWFILGVFVGVLVGILVVGLCAINQREEQSWRQS